MLALSVFKHTAPPVRARKHKYLVGCCQQQRMAPDSVTRYNSPVWNLLEHNGTATIRPTVMNVSYVIAIEKFPSRLAPEISKGYLQMMSENNESVFL